MPAINDHMKILELEDRHVLHYKGQKDDRTWTGEQKIDLNHFFGDTNGFFDAWKGGYADKSKEEAVEPEYESEIHFAEPKLKAKMLEDDGTTWRERQGIFLYKYFNLKDGTLDYKGPIKPPPPP
ncbi:hypothetical protein TCE0_024r07544 [Talaromyces pinophilus]|uniref:Cyanovirin-N domain-containing protein n=1 Tax=Talaromyces pinophilus TaxID=128442 RepID=A0A6V8H947_TALPI|nr:hypothetical protein TCE0_024r07544 [Talaromyces pinophilus]